MKQARTTTRMREASAPQPAGTSANAPDGLTIPRRPGQMPNVPGFLQQQRNTPKGQGLSDDPSHSPPAQPAVSPGEPLGRKQVDEIMMALAKMLLYSGQATIR